MYLILRGCADGYADVWRQKMIFRSSGLISRVAGDGQQGWEVAPSLALEHHGWQQNEVNSHFFDVLHGQWDLC